MKKNVKITNGLTIVFLTTIIILFSGCHTMNIVDDSDQIETDLTTTEIKKGSSGESLTVENTGTELAKMEEEIYAKEDELLLAEQTLDEAEIANYEEAEQSTEITNEKDEEIYLAGLEDDLNEYDEMIEEVESLTNELEVLLDDYNQALASTAEFYDELNENAQQAVDTGEDIYKTINASVGEAQDQAEEAKTELEAMSELVKIRKELWAQNKDNMSGQLEETAQYWQTMKIQFDTLNKSNGNNFSKQFVNKYFAQLPSYLNHSQMGSLGGNATIPDMSGIDNGFNIPKLNR